MPLTRVYSQAEELLSEYAEKQEKLLRERKQALDSKTNFFLVFSGLLSNFLLFAAPYGPEPIGLLGVAFWTAVAVAAGFVALATEAILMSALQQDYQMSASSTDYTEAYRALKKHYETFTNADADTLCVADLKEWLRDARNAVNDNNAAVNNRRAQQLVAASRRLCGSLASLIVILTILALWRLLNV